MGQLRNAAIRLSRLKDRFGQPLYPDIKKYTQIFDFSANRRDGLVEVEAQSKYTQGVRLTVSMAEPVDPAVVQLRALMEVYRKYRITSLQGAAQLEPRDDPDEGGPIPNSSLINFALRASGDPQVGNVFPLEVSAPLSQAGTPIIYPTPQYIQAFYDLPGNAEAKAEFDASWISVDNPEGVAKASGKIFQPARDNLLDAETYVSGFVSYMFHQNVGAFAGTMEPPSWSLAEMLRIPVPKGKKSGITTFKRDAFIDALGKTVKLASTADKETMRVSTAHEIATYAEFFASASALRDREATFEDLIDILNKMVAKAEVRQRGDDPDKVRLFFIVSIIKYMMDVNMKKPTHRHRMNNGHNTIGHSWVGGGAERFFENLGGLGPDDETCEWANADVSQKDTQFKAKDLLVQMLFAWVYYKEEKVLREFMKYSAHQAAFKLVRWLTNEECWAFVVGVLLSGDLETGMGNTDHLGTAWEQFVLHQIKKHGPEFPDLYHAIEHPLLRFCVQGDDICQRTPGKFVPWLGNAVFEKWLSRNYLMKFKEVTRTTNPFSYLHPEEIKIGKFRLSTKGIKFLKRHFLVINWGGKLIPAPFREAPDYFVRVGRTNQDQADPAKCIARCVGLLWDTMGTNPEAENFLIRAVQHCVLSLGLHSTHPDYPAFIESLRESVLADEFVAGRAYRWSMTAEEIARSVGNFPGLVNMEVVRAKFLLRTPSADERYGARDDRAPDRSHIGLLPPLFQPVIDTADGDEY